MNTHFTYTYDEISLQVVADCRTTGDVTVLAAYLDGINIFPLLADHIIFDISLYLETQSIGEE